ncbi:hypothetical protein HK101_007003 [Irineochytrium annulatum]|nr:hypothetical protein HK101_007003 [Irineochytrium annulatum]
MPAGHVILVQTCLKPVSHCFGQSYQKQQESSFQELLLRDLNDKSAELERQINVIRNVANHEIQTLREKVAALQAENAKERNRHQDIIDQLAEKTRNFQKLQELYDKIKRRSIQPQSGSLPPSYASTNTASRTVSNVYGSSRRPHGFGDSSHGGVNPLGDHHGSHGVNIGNSGPPTPATLSNARDHARDVGMSWRAMAAGGARGNNNPPTPFFAATNAAGRQTGRRTVRVD